MATRSRRDGCKRLAGPQPAASLTLLALPAHRAALQALESFVQRSPADARPHLGDVLAVGLEALRHDPNFADDMQDDSDGAGGARLCFLCFCAKSSIT